MVETSRVESEHGIWKQTNWAPSAGDALAGLVERIWDFEGTLASRRERVFPNGALELVVQLDEPHRPVRDMVAAPFPPICVDGLATKATMIEGPRGFFRVLGMRLHPCGAFTLLGYALDTLSDRTVELSAVVGRAADELGQRLASAGDGTQRVRAAQNWALARLARAPEPDALVVAVTRQIVRDPGRAILQLPELGGRSRSRFAAAFRNQVGLAPKRYARIMRFRRALELLTAGGATLSAVAAAAGYYDQAHMSAEFREHAGLSPRSYAMAVRYPGSSHLAESADEVDNGSFLQDDVERGG